MYFSYYPLGYRTGGQTFSIKLNQQAHVALLDTQNLNRFFHSQNFRHYGRLQSINEERYYIPAPGNWHIVITSDTKINDIGSKIIFR